MNLASLGVHRHYLSIVVSSPFSSRNRESKWTVARGVHPTTKYTPRRRKRTGLEKRKRDLLKRAPVVLERLLENEIASHDFFLPIRDPHATIPEKFFLPVHDHAFRSKKKYIKSKPKF